MGGRDISKEDIEEMFLRLLGESKYLKNKRVQFIGMRVAINE